MSRSSRRSGKPVLDTKHLTTLGLVRRGGDILLIRRKREPNKGLFVAPGGKIRLRESPHECVLREVEEETGDMDAGTGIWSHDETKAIGYTLLLDRFFSQLSQKNPDHALSGTKSYKIPPPQCMREGNRKTVFANIADICKRMKRTEEHLTAYLFAELGTNGSVDGSRRLVIKGRFQQKQIENMVRKYISTSPVPPSWLP